MSISFNGYTIEPNADLSDTNLSGADLSNANLSNINFSNANLSNVNLNSADLSGAIFDGTRLENIDLTDANLLGAKLVNIVGSPPNLPLGYIYLNGAIYGPKLDLTTSKFDENPTNTTLNLSGANLSYNENIQTKNFEGALFIGSNLKGVYFGQETVLDDADFSYAFAPTSNFTRTDSDSVIFSNAYIKGAQFYEAEFSNSDFSNADLSNSNLVS